MEVSKSRKICIYILAIFLIFSPIVVFNYSNNEKIEKEIKENKLKTLEQEGENYRLVTSADNVQVPVPKGYVASQIEGENYVTPEYSYTTIIHKVSSTPTELTWSSPEGQQYPWTQDENGIWISGNQGIALSSSILESEEFDYIKGTTLTINYTYSSYGFDVLIIELINITSNEIHRIVRVAGNSQASFDYLTSNYTYTSNDFETGKYKIRATFSKDNLSNYGQDSGYIKGATYFKEDENGTQTFEEEIKTKIHDGGFVIYQLKDAEVETDPNGTNIIINDINKDIAQSERNQYVWVPVPNIEDIARTKMENNGIMQFGQTYSFSNTSITKETNSSGGYFREPRLVEQFDKTKHYLQRYSYLDKERENYLNKMQEENKRVINSINKYKGFYIGRYETGDEYSHNSNIKCFINPKIVRYNRNINYVSWYNSYKDLEKLSGKTEEYVETGMIYDNLWDYTLKWINETDTRSYKDIGSDSRTWGNYFTNTKTVTTGVTDPASTGAIETITYYGETYSDSPTSSNNIFDMAGNVNEWTRTRDAASWRRRRGGSCSSDDNAPSVTNFSYSPSYYGGLCGVRGMLLIR